jgi:hypothetical protein
VFGRESEFIRTPKCGDRVQKRYRVATPVLPWIEIAIGTYCAASLLVYLGSGRLLIGPFLMIYAIGFMVIGAIGLWEFRAVRAAAA